MATDEEARTRAVLAEMQLRISQGPSAALGLGDAYGPEEVRAAFLAMTKQFHPARFGRMASDVQKLSNEVFLGIKSAHETLMRTLGASPRPTGSSRLSTGMKPLTVEASRTTTGSIPRMDGHGASPGSQPLARGTDRETGRVPVMSPGPTGSFARVEPTPAPHSGASARPAVGRANTPLGHPGAPVRSTGSIPTARPMQTGSMPKLDPAALSAPTQRGGQPGTPPTSPPPATNFNVSTQRGFDSAPGGQQGVPAQQTQPIPRLTPTPAASARSADEQATYREALRYIQQANWNAARASLLALSAKAPNSKQYESLLHYARGREAQIAGNAETALLEYQRALAVDPDLSVVKQAVAELQRRR